MILLICLNNRSLIVDCWHRCRVDLWKIDFNTWFDSNQTMFKIRSAQVDISGVNEISPLLSCPFWFGVMTHIIIN